MGVRLQADPKARPTCCRVEHWRGIVARSWSGRLARYLTHLAVILWWLLDKSPGQRATDSLVRLIDSARPAAAMTLRLPKVGRFILAGDRLFQDALIGDPAAGKTTSSR